MQPNVEELIKRLEPYWVIKYLQSPETLALFQETSGPLEVRRFPYTWNDWVAVFGDKTGLQFPAWTAITPANNIFSITPANYQPDGNTLAVLKQTIDAVGKEEYQITNVSLWFNLDSEQLEVIQVHAISPDPVSAEKGIYENRYLVAGGGPIVAADDDYTEVFQDRIIEGIIDGKSFGFMYFRVASLSEMKPFELWDCLNWESLPYRYL
jgi:hypothetical protein